MGPRIPRNRKPSVEPVEPRVLLSLLTDVMAGKQQALYTSKARAVAAHVAQASNPAATPPVHAFVGAGGGGAGGGGGGGGSGGSGAPNGTISSNGRLIPTSNSVAVPSNQGYQQPAFPGYNLIIQPTGTASPREVRRQLFKAVYRGPYIITPGDFSSQAYQVFIRGAGSASSMLHSDIQMRLAVPTDPSLVITGATGIFDRNLNSNTVLGLDLATPLSNVDSRGRPNLITSVTLDVNASAGVYDEAFAQGVVQIHYYPGPRNIPGAIDQGTAVVKVYGQIYTADVAFILRNSNLNP